MRACVRARACVRTSDNKIAKSLQLPLLNTKPKILHHLLISLLCFYLLLPPSLSCPLSLSSHTPSHTLLLTTHTHTYTYLNT